MTFVLATFYTERLLAFAIFLQAVEIHFVCRSPIFKSVWAIENVSGEFAGALPLFVQRIFAETGFRCVVGAQILLALGAFAFPCAPLFIGLTLTHLLICFRFRGSFNGGSDMMTFVILTGVLILTLGPTEQAQRLGFFYIAIQAIYSYVKAGIVKLRAPEWRNGTALSVFLSRSLYADVKRIGIILRFKPMLARAFAWLGLIFEISLLALPFAPRAVSAYFFAAVLFHFINYRAFGLNRFFWIWLAAWPSIFFLSSHPSLLS